MWLYRDETLKPTVLGGSTIITKSAKGVYQKHGYMPTTPRPKIGFANKAP
jgi:hypothetical protein